MEEKKSSAADLESGRLQSFLIGLIVVLAMLFVALEYNFTDEDYDEADIAELEELLQDVELAPLNMPEEMQPIAQASTPEKPTRINIVDDSEVSESPEDSEDPLAPEDSEDPLASETLEDPVALSPQEDSDYPLDIQAVEELPQFPGGAGAFMKWLTRNLSYPQAAQRQKIQGKVMAQFIVNKDGTVDDIQIVQPLHPVCDREALRVLRTMPKWKAGRQHDKPCRTMVCIPIVFHL